MQLAEGVAKFCHGVEYVPNPRLRKAEGDIVGAGGDIVCLVAALNYQSKSANQPQCAWAAMVLRLLCLHQH